MKEQIRTNLKLLEDNMPHFNDLSLQFIDKKKVRRHISVWRWFISHGYFKDGHPRPEGIASNPPIEWLNSHLQGQTVPLTKDIGSCTTPHIQSGLMTEHAARRIMNRLGCITNYVSEEAAKQSQQDHRDREDKKVKDRRRAAKTRVDRKAERKEEHKRFIDKEGSRLGKERKKKKKDERKQYKQALDARKKAVHEKAVRELSKMKKAMKERSK